MLIGRHPLDFGSAMGDLGATHLRGASFIYMCELWRTGQWLRKRSGFGLSLNDVLAVAFGSFFMCVLGCCFYRRLRFLLTAVLLACLYPSPGIFFRALLRAKAAPCSVEKMVKRCCFTNEAKTLLKQTNAAISAPTTSKYLVNRYLTLCRRSKNGLIYAICCNFPPNG